MPRFAIVRHEGPRGLHFDLLLEMGEKLKTWALPQPPEPDNEMTCEALPDYRPAYLDYEGPLSDDRGSVTRWDRGTYRLQRQSDTELIVELRGAKLAGLATLRRLPERPGYWRFSFTAQSSRV